jgi:DNA-binding SARP family transcriptional activator
VIFAGGVVERTAGETEVAASTLHFDLLGEPRWRTPAAHGRLAAHDAAFVALLAIEGPQARDVLFGRLSPGTNSKTAGVKMRQRIKRLRERTGHLIVDAGDSIRFLADVRCDLQSLAEIDADALLDAQDLLAGCEFGDNEFLEGWVLTQRERLRRERADVLAGHAAALQERGELAKALRMAERIVALAPPLEHGWRRLMRLHYLRGDRSAAIEAFERFETLMREETGARPSAETLQLLRDIEHAEHIAPSAPQVVPVSLVRPPLRVGREREWRAMARAWSAGRAFLMMGDAGIGKTRLLTDLQQASPGARMDRSRPGDAQTPYAVLARLVRCVLPMLRRPPDETTRAELARIAPELGIAPASPAQEAALWRAVENLLQAAAASGLTALLVDDLHFADTATLDALRWLSASPQLTCLHFGFASRPLASSPHARLLRDWLDDSHRPERIEVAPLTQADIEQLVGSIGLPAFAEPGVCARLFAHAGGHPLFTLETLKDAFLHGRSLVGEALPVPTTVQDLLERRLSELPEACASLLRVAAVAGAELTVERAARMLGRSPLQLAEAWTRLETANVLAGQRFAHDLVHESALRLVPSALRRVLHAALAALLAEDGSVNPARVGAHWQAAERWGEAARCWFAAGASARQAGRLVEEVDLLERSADCHHRAGDEAGEFDARAAVFYSVLLRHGPAKGLEALPALQLLAQTPAQRMQCLLIRAEAMIDLERGSEALGDTEAALQQARSNPEHLSDALCLHGMALVQSGRVQEAVFTEEQAAEVARSAGLKVQEQRAVSSLAYVLYTAGRLGESVKAHAESLRLADALGHQTEAAAAAAEIAATLAVVGDVPASREWARRARRRFVDMGFERDSPLGCINLMVLGNGAAYLGEFSEAFEALTEAVRMSSERARSNLQGQSLVGLALLSLTLGDSGKVRALVDRLPEDTIPGRRMQAELLLARAEEMDGHDGAPHFRRLDALMQRHPDLPLVQSAWIEWSYQGDPSLVVARLRPVRAEFEAQGLHGTARLLLLREIDRLGDIDAPDASAVAAQHARLLLPYVAEGMSAKTYVPEAWCILARAFERIGDSAQTAACLDLARNWILERALPKVPHDRRQAFLTHNPVNRRVLSASTERPRA